MKKISVKEALPIYNLINNAKISSLETNDIISIVKNIKNLQKIVNDFEETKVTTLQKLKDDNFDEMVKKRVNGEDRDITEPYFEKYNKKCVEALNDDYIKERNIDLQKISEEGIIQLIKDNDWTPLQASLLLF